MKGFDDHLDNYGDPNPGGEVSSVKSGGEVYEEGERGYPVYPQAQEDAIQSVLSCMPYAQVFDGEGEVLILCDGGNYLISVDTEGSTSSAYLYAAPPEGDSNASIDDEAVIAEPGWATGWEC